MTYNTTYMAKSTFTFALLYIIHFLASGQNVAISHDKFKVLYANFNNPISISVSNLSCKNIFLKAESSVIQRIDSCSYFINPEKIHPETIYIYNANNNDTILIDTLTYVVKSIPMPSAKIMNPPDEYNLISVPNKLIASIDNFDYTISYSVISYCIKSYKESILQDSIPVESNIIGNRINNVFMKLESGENCWIDNIKVKREDGKIEDINAIFIKKF